MSSPWRGTSLGIGIIKTMLGVWRVHVLHYANAPVLTQEETGRYDLAWKDLCSVLNALK